MQPLVLISLLVIFLAGLAIYKLLRGGDEEPIDVTPDMTASDVMLGLCLGTVAVVSIAAFIIAIISSIPMGG